MKPFFLVLLVAVLWAFLFSSSATACINDSSTVKAEQEFKSSYFDREFKSRYQGTPQPASQPAGNRLALFALSGIGVALLGGACFVSLRRPRKPSA
jgi:hypothetical protein